MSLLFNYNDFDERKIQLKSPFKRIINNDSFSFFPLRYKKQEIYVKTPKIVVPFGLNIYTNDNGKKSYSCNLSLTDMDIDPNINKFYDFILKTEKFCCLKVQNMETITSQGHDSLQLKSSIKMSGETPLFRIKITPNVTELYDERGKLRNMDEIEQLITEHCHIISLIEMNNIWINSHEFGITWKVIQMGIYPSTRPIGGISLLNENVKIHETQPVIRPKGINPLMNCFSMISAGNFNLKKTTQIEPRSKLKPKSIQPQISLDEILNMKNRLRSRKC